MSAPGPNVDAFHIELAKQLRRHLPLAVLCNTPAVGLMCIALWHASPWFLSAWLAVTCLHGGWVLVHVRTTRGCGNLDIAKAQRLMRFARQVALLIGLSWVVSLLYLYPTVGETREYLAYAVLLMSVGAVFGYGMDLGAFHRFVVPYALAMLIALAITPTPQRVVLGGGMAVFFASILYFARTYNRMFHTALRTRYENAELVQELLAQKEIAEAANLAKSRFLAAASHDLRQPLHALTLLAGGVEEKNRDPLLQPAITGIHRSVAEMMALFEDLLDISRMESQSPVRKHFPLQPLMARLQHEFASLAQHKQLRLSVRPTSAIVHSDPLMLERILRNLIGNALKYTQHGGVLVAARPSSQGGHRIEVWDTGLGIAESEHQRIFEDFYQIDNPQRTRKEGAGLGLAIVQRLAISLGHTVTLRSRVGRGSVFKLDVPRGDEACALPAPATLDPPRPDALLDGARVLVFDDEEAVVSALEMVLANWRVDVIGASSLPAIERLMPAQEAVDFIIVDYQISPSLHGGQFIQAMRERWGRTVPALVLTGSLAAVDAQTRQLDRVSVLAKPLAAGRLKALLIHELRKSAGLD